MQLSPQHVAPFVEGVEWGLGTKGLRIVAAFWAGSSDTRIYFHICQKLHLLFSELNDSKAKCFQNHVCISLHRIKEIAPPPSSCCL